MSEPNPTTGVPTCYRHPGRESYISCQRCGRTICPDCMRDAAVGFQCPDCVADGAKQTRAGRTAYGGLRPTNASITSLVLIGINVAVWAAIFVSGGYSSGILSQLQLVPSGCAPGNLPGGACISLRPGVVNGAPWQVITGGFTHVAILHIAFNMFALYSIGPQLETALGRTRFLALYFLSLVAGSVAAMWFGSEYQATVGASGAIYGLFAALIVIVHKIGGDLRQLFVLVGVNLFITFAIPNISWQGHLGGFVAGALVTAILVYAPKGASRTRYQILGLSVVAVLLVGGLLVRGAMLA